MALRTARWTCTPYYVAAAERIAAELGVSRQLATILARRGCSDPESARRLLDATERHDPLDFARIGAACDAILGHVRAGSRIVVHGDYDVDGVCSTAILVEALRWLGAEPAWHVPDREDGYGLSVATVERLVAAGTRLIVTADCAVAAVDEVARARELGVDVVVTDHHRPAERLPDCPIVHPAVCGYPFPHLCAAAVAQKLAEALLARAGADPARAAEHADLVALATVADVVPLVGENRRLVREGLRAIARTRRPGLRALMRVAAVDPGAVREHAVGFRLAPRLNAAGRLARADAALELLMTGDEGRAEEVARELDELNRRRQDTETRILFSAEAARADQADAPAYVLAGEGWHPGVIGIVASRMVERHHRPCVVVALDGDGGRGSGRSIPAYDLHAGLAACSGHLRRFGGHRAAAGLEIDADGVDAFRAAFVEHAASALSPADLVPVERIDAVVGADAVGAPLAEELQRLAPFGHGNPSPTLLVPAARVGEVRAMGAERQHARFTIAGGGARANVVAFGTAAGSLPASPDERWDAAVRLELNEWNGTVEPRLVLRSLCPTERGECRPAAPAPGFAEAFERERRRDVAAIETPPSARAVRDRRGHGFAGVAGELLSSGESVAIVCADAERRRAGLEEVVAGVARAVTGADGEERCPGLLAWDDLAEDPSLARPFTHLVALDPPLTEDGEALLAAAPAPEPAEPRGSAADAAAPAPEPAEPRGAAAPAAAPAGFAHLAWGPAEVELALALARRDLDLRPVLAAVYRDLRAAGPCRGERLLAVLRGDPPRSAAACGRAVRVLCELGLAELDSAGPAARALDAPRTELDRSPTYRACAARLAAATAYLAAPARAA
ncbi:MAG TPA: single-stranded-DNA-specific exonuclease RecJ [Thermoleophilaceae bacterium]|jgi:single-stranded-DNA-specific exonuclease